MSYIGNNVTMQVHRETCKWAVRIERNRRTFFDTLEEAFSRNYDGCSYCLRKFDRRNGYVRENVRRYAGQMLADRFGRDAKTMRKMYVAWKEGDESSATPSVSLRSLFTFPDQSMMDDTGEVEAEKENLEFYKTVGSEKDVWSFAKDKAVLKIPVNCDLKKQSFFSTRLMLPKNTKDGRILLLKGPDQLPIDVWLNVSKGKFTVIVQLKTVADDMIQFESEYSFYLDKWHTITVVFTQKEIDIIADDDKKCISRKLLFHDVEGVDKRENCFTIGYNAENEKSQFRGYLSTFEYEDEIKEDHQKMIAVAAETGMGAIEHCYESVDGESTLGKLEKQVILDDGGICCEYENGNIYWSKDSDAICVRKGILRFYVLYGGPAGVLGYPVSNTRKGKLSGVTVQYFLKGAIYLKRYDDGTEIGGAIFGKPYYKYRLMGEDSAGIGIPYSGAYNETDPEHPFDTRLKNGFYRSTFCELKSLNPGHQYNYSYMYYSDQTDVAVFPYGPMANIAEELISRYGYPCADTYVMNTAGSGIKDCYMVFQKGFLFWSCTGTDGTMMRPTFLTGDFMREYFDRGGYDVLGMPQNRNKRKNEYLDCTKGTLVQHQGNFYFIDEIQFEISEAIAGKIDDGIHWNFSKDHTPELSYYLTLEPSNDRVKQNTGLVRFDSEYYRSKTSKRRTFPQSRFKMKICGDSTIYFFVKYVDWDAVTENDYLGSVRKTLNVDNLWGLTPGYINNDEDPNLEGEEELLLDDYGKDASKEKYATVKTTYHVKQIDGEQYELNPDTFRVDSWWAFDNFKNRNNLSSDFVSTVFRDMEYVESTWDKICNPLDSAFYEGAKIAGKHGNCFGMCLAAVEAYYQVGRYSMPVRRYRANAANSEELEYDDEITDKKLREYLQECQLRQLTAPSVKALVAEFFDRNIQKPSNIFGIVENEVKENKFCIISMLNVVQGLKAHAVLAYRTEKKSEEEWVIFVADPNYTSRYVSIDNQNHRLLDTNKIVVNPQKETFQYMKANSSGVFINDSVYRTTTKTDLINTKNAKYDGAIMATPYRLVSGTPITPTWEILKAVIMLPLNYGEKIDIFGLLGIFGDADNVIVECDGSEAKMENNDIVPLVFPSDGGTSDAQIYILTKPASTYRIKYTGKSAGKVKQTLETAKKIFTVESEIAKGETAVVSASLEKEMRTALSVSGIKNKQITLEIKSKRLGVHNENSERLELKTDASGKTAALKLNALTEETKIQGAARGNFSIMKQVRRSRDTIDASRLNLTSNGSNEEISVLKPRFFAMKDVLVQRVDVGTRKLKSREICAFKEKSML